MAAKSNFARLEPWVRLMQQGVLLLALLAVAVLFVYLTWSIYHATRGLTASDIEPIEKSLERVENALKDDTASKGILSELRQNREKLETDLQLILKPGSASSGGSTQNDITRQAAIEEISKVMHDLALLQTRLDSGTDNNQEMVSDALSKLQILRQGIEPTAAPEKIIGMVLTRTGGLIVQLAWPLAALVIFFYLFRSPRAPERIAALFSNFKSVELFSAKLEVGDRIKFSAEETFDNFRKQAKNSFDHWVQKKSLEEKIRGLLSDTSIGVVAKINEARQQLNPPKAPLTDYRCTLHVPDLLFAETFYQLLDYIPRQSGPETRARTWSYRFGFIGKLWRSEKSSDIWGTVPTNTEELINNWGMTREEAENAGKGRKSFLGVMLTYHSVPVGLFYMDATGENEFGLDSNGTLRDHISKQCDQREITKDLAEIAEELRGQAALIRIYTQR